MKIKATADEHQPSVLFSPIFFLLHTMTLDKLRECATVGMVMAGHQYKNKSSIGMFNL